MQTSSRRGQIVLECALNVSTFALTDPHVVHLSTDQVSELRIRFWRELADRDL